VVEENRPHYYGTHPEFNYWNGCSIGGSPGHAFGSSYSNTATIRVRLQIDRRTRELASSSLPSTIGLDTSAYGMHTLRRTKASLIYEQQRDF
jgi:hypothetical protein